MEGQRALRFHQKYLNLCSQDERRPYGFETTWAWVINDRIFIFGRTNSLITSLISDLYLFSLFHTFSAFTLQFSQSLWCISRIVLNISKDLCVFLKTIHTNSTTQWISWKSDVTFSKSLVHLSFHLSSLESLVHLSKVSIYVNEHISAIRMKSPCVIKQDSQND